MADAIYESLTARRKKASRNGESMFLGIPDSWYEGGKWRCENGHVSTRYLKSEVRGPCCLACDGAVRITFPDDEEATVG